MKKIFFALIIVLALGVGIFYFFAGRDIAVDYYIDKAMEQTDLNKTVKYYNKALDLSPENITARNEIVDIYIKTDHLDYAYREIAEGISNNASNVELFLKRVKLYEKEGKISEAIDSMQNIESNYVQVKISGKKDIKPIFNYKSGEYDEILQIELKTSKPATIYYRINNDEYLKYETSFEISDDFTIIDAVAIDENGIVSDQVRNEYQIINITSPVVFTNDAIMLEVLEQVKSLAPEDFDDPKSIDLTAQEIYDDDLKTLSNFKNLESLKLGDVSYVTSFSSLSNLKNLKEITIDSGLSYDGLCQLLTINSLKEIEVVNSNIMQLPQNRILIDKLVLKNCLISDISEISSYKSLTYLDLSNNQIEDISNISDIKKIKFLDLSYNNINDISNLGEIVSINEINVGFNNLNDIKSLSKMLFLEKVNISHNDIISVKGLENLNYLEYLDCSFNSILTLEILKQSKSLKTIYANDNSITDLSYLSEMASVSYINTMNNAIISY